MEDHGSTRDLSHAARVKLDTSGHVRRPGFAKPLRWSDLDPFEQGYVEALFSGFMRSDFAHAFAHRPSAIGLKFSDLAPETLARIIADCAAEQREPTPAGTNMQGEGRAFWSLRSRGFYPKWTPLAPYLGDDGRVYLREPT